METKAAAEKEDHRPSADKADRIGPVSKVILGRMKSGKTTLAAKFLRCAPPGLIVDANDEHKIRLKTSDHNTLLTWLSKPLVEHVSYVPDYEDRDEYNTLCDVVWHLRIPYFHTEEIADFIPLKKQSAFLRLWRRYRHRGIFMVATSQRPAEIPRTMTANNDVYIFRVTEETDKKFCDGLVPNYTSLADGLKDHECIVYHGARGITHVVPENWRPGTKIQIPEGSKNGH